jgi:hypothetical protein
MGFENPFSKKDNLPKHLQSKDEHKDNLPINNGSEVDEFIKDETEDEFLKEKELRYKVDTSKTGKLYKGEFKTGENSVDEEATDELMNAEYFADPLEDETEDEKENRLRIEQHRREVAESYDREHAGENGISGMKKPDISGANFTEKVSFKYNDKFRKPRPVIESKEDLENQGKKAA